MAINLPTRLGNGLYLICVMSFVIGIVLNHVNLMTHEHPLDYNEAGMLVITSTIAHRDNPYSLKNQPTRMSVYPVLYNILVAPFSRVFGNTLTLHRVVNGFFIVASCVLCFYLCRKESGTRSESFIAGALLYAGLLYYSTPIASPNGLGLFLFLSAVTVPWVHGFSTRSLAVTILLGILAFYAKQYFIACLGYVALYLFLAESKKRSIYFGLAATAAFAVVLILVCSTSPYYLEDTFFAVQSSAKIAASDAEAIKQLGEYIQIYLPLLIILTIVMIYKYRSKILLSRQHAHNSQRQPILNLLDFDKPLLLRKPNYIWICCACSVIIIVLALGKNRGNHLTYLFQLISPFLLAGIFALISTSDMPKWRWPFRVLVVVALYNLYSILPADFSVDEKNWRILRNEISGANDIYASTLVLPEILNKGAPVYDNGHSRYFAFGRDKPPLFVKSGRGNTVQEVWENYVKLVQTKIKNREFDLLLIDHWMPLPNSLHEPAVDTKTLLKQYYKQTAVIRLPLAHRPGGGGYNVSVWKPIRGKPEEDKQQPQ